MDVPGHAFYSGEAGFAGGSRLYLLAENPGSDGMETVSSAVTPPQGRAVGVLRFRDTHVEPAGRIDHSVLHLLRRRCVATRGTRT
jgi:hypothetical protein